MHKKKSVIVFFILMSVVLLYGCGDIENNKTEPKNESNSQWQSELRQSVDSSAGQSMMGQQSSSLVIHPWCIWCSRCVFLAPNNFAMQWRDAIVISNENINSPQVQKAIQHCPVDVIEVI